MNTNNLSKENFIFEPYINYESILCYLIPDEENQEKKVNSSCMGVHFTPNQEVYMFAYDGTQTKKNLTIGKIFSINFSEDIYDYVISGLKFKNSAKELNELPKESFRSINPLPILKSSWCSVICEVIQMPEKLMTRPECRRREDPNIRAKVLDIKLYHYPKIFNNRSMNLAIEALIYATRIPLYEPFSHIYNESISSYVYIKRKISEWRDMVRFGEIFEIIDNYLIRNGIKPQEISNF